jgi:histidinol dehydrogenase
MITLGLPEGKCSKPLQNVDNYVPVHMASYLGTVEFTVVQ